MGVRWDALKDMGVRYRDGFVRAWRERFNMESPSRNADEREFLPAALSLQETPVHPAPKIVTALIIAFFVIALLWALVGKIDIVATAPGKVIPGDRIKLIQPYDTAIIKAIHVKEGQKVASGELLVELDPTEFMADRARLRTELEVLRFEAARTNALLDALKEGGGPLPLQQYYTDAPHQRLLQEEQALTTQHAEYLSRRDELRAEFMRIKSQRNTTIKALDKLRELQPLIEQRAADYEELVASSHVARHAYLEQKQQLVSMNHDLSVQQARLEELDASLLESEKRLTALKASTRRVWRDQFNKASNEILGLEQELVKTEQRLRRTQLRAPVTGTVQQLAVHTIGGVAQKAQPLMVIVPSNDKLEVEAFIANRDIGFVYAGQRAQVKVEAFPYTKYGKIGGTVLSISEDAIEREDMGLVYAARVLLDRTDILVGNKHVSLSPGMAVSSEISTGMRRVIEYFLSPLKRYQDESLKER